MARRGRPTRSGVPRGRSMWTLWAVAIVSLLVRPLSAFPSLPPHHYKLSLVPYISPPTALLHGGRGGRLPAIDPVVIGRAAHEATGFDKDALNRSMKMPVPTMGPTTDFTH
jgi:hypothetical protein